jgi:Co/Zn/Cd efflux system component
MAHYRKQIAAAVALNTGIFVIDAAAGYQASSPALIMDSVLTP